MEKVVILRMQSLPKMLSLEILVTSHLLLEFGLGFLLFVNVST